MKIRFVMNKGIWAIAVIGAFLLGAMTSNPFAEAVGGWKEAIEQLQGNIPTIITRTDNSVLEPNVSFSEGFPCDDDEVILGGSFETSGPTTAVIGDVNHRDQTYDVVLFHINPSAITVKVIWVCLDVSST